MSNFFQSETYCSLFKNVACARVHKIKYTHRGILNQIIATQYFQKKTFLPLNPIIINGLFAEEAADVITSSHIRIIFSSIKSHSFIKSTHLEFRNSFNHLTNTRAFTKLGFTIQNRLNYLLNTSRSDLAWQNLANNRKRQIRSALKNGVKVIIANEENQVREFYQMLSNLYHQKIKKQIPEINLFINILNLSNKGAPIKIFLVTYQNRIIGGNICPYEPGKKIYEWYVCNLRKLNNRIYPGALATWAPITYACEQNIPLFDFMGAGISGIPYGVREFKKKFGGNIISTNRFIYELSY